MKILFYTSGARFHEDLGLLMDEAIILSKEGHEVYFLYNNCSLGTCTLNLSQNSHLCAVCQQNMKHALKNLPKTIKTINLGEFWRDDNNIHFEYKSIKEIKRIEYKHVKIGYSVLSSYFTITRNLCPIIDDSFKSFIDRILIVSCRLTDALEDAINQIQPDRLCFFNSRFFEWRPAFDLAILHGIEAVSYERTTDLNKKNCKQRFYNSTPHNIANLQKRCSAIWDKTDITLKEKIEIGNSFFEKRRNGIAANDRVYTSNQERGKLPVDWDESKRNIVIFNSSEDEYAAIGDEYDSKSIFPTQYQGIKYILGLLEDEKNIHVYLRIHPNLKDVPYRYHKELEKLAEQYDHITVINAAESVSTYALMDAAEKVVVFGSTMGIEAAYWGKPVVLLAGAFYYYSDLCYIPKTREEIRDLLLGELPPKPNKEAIKWGFYFMYRNPDNRYKYVDWDAEWLNIMGVPVLNIHYLKLLGSSQLYAIYQKISNKIFKIHRKINPKIETSILIPLEEDMQAEL